MAEGNNPYICLKLADKSLYSLYKPGEKGDKSLTVTPARSGQVKNEISLFDCTGGRERLLRDILLENPGDMILHFSLSHGYLSYRVTGEEGGELDKGLIELSLVEADSPSRISSTERTDKTRKTITSPKRGGLIILSVLISLVVLLIGGYIMADRSDRTELPPLSRSEMTPR
ncbi:MAG: hypothetical protein PQJ59_11020 [Spirochaetales bacterium]|nr:hypothetical protein [Spirochaetales bacterium]